MKKTSFETHEEEFQALTNQLQLSLAAPRSSSSDAGIKVQFNLCQDVLQQLKREAKVDLEFQDRLRLYQLQMKTLQDYHGNKDTSRGVQLGQQEITFHPCRYHLWACPGMLEKSRKNQTED